MFSCESDVRKRKWITAHFPHLTRLYNDVHDVGRGRGLNTISGALEDVPSDIDVVIVGFCCQDVSFDNPSRSSSALGVASGSGRTGGTFASLLSYVGFARPSVVIWENVMGLLAPVGEAPPPVRAVETGFSSIGYTTGWRIINTKEHLLPQNRRRVYGWSLEGRGWDVAVSGIDASVQGMACPDAMPLDYFFAGSCSVPRTLRGRQRAAAAAAVSRAQVALARVGQRGARAADAGGSQYVVDINRSEKRASAMCSIAPCITTRSIIYRSGRILTPIGKLSLLGITSHDFCGLARPEQGQTTLWSSLAGNAMALPVVVSVSFGVLAHYLVAVLKHRQTPDSMVMHGNDSGPLSTVGAGSQLMALKARDIPEALATERKTEANQRLTDRNRHEALQGVQLVEKGIRLLRCHVRSESSHLQRALRDMVGVQQALADVFPVGSCVMDLQDQAPGSKAGTKRQLTKLGNTGAKRPR